MAQEQNISTQLDNLLVTRNFSPEMLDRQGKPSESEDAKTFTFDYVSGSGKNYGTMVVILDSENDMKVFYGDNLGRAMEGDDKDEFFDFQQHLSKFARMHRWTYTAKDLNQLKHTMQGLAAIQEGLFEGYYGTRKISYAGEPTEARLMIKHNRTLGEADARFRYVESLFIETADSQRFRLPFKNLAGGRAMLEHVRQGGNPYDIRGVHISEMVMEIATLSRFNRASASRMLEGTTKELVTEAQTYYKSLRENMKRMASPRGYNAYFETWHPATIDEQQDLVEDIKTLFIEQTLDTRIEAALPLLARIQQQGNAMKEAEIFESWINNLSEGTWSLPETPEQLNRLKELMATELIVGPDATNATEQLYDLIGDDELFDRLSDLAERDPRANVWDDTEVMDRLVELGIQTPEPTEPGNPAEPQTAPEQQGVAEGWKDEADDFTEWSNHVKEKLSKASPEQRLGLAKQLSQLEVKHFGSNIPNTFNKQTGKPQAGLGLTDTVRNALKYFNAEQTGIRQYYDQDLPSGTFGNKFGSVTIDGMENATPAELAIMAKAVRAGADYARAAGRIYRKTGTITQQDLDKIRQGFDDNANKFATSIGAQMDYSNRPEEPTALAQASLSRRDRAMAESAGLGVDAKGRTQAQWLALVNAKFPKGGPVTVVKLLQSKMPDGPIIASLSNGKQIGWSKVEQDVAESAELNTMLKYAGVPVTEGVLTDSTGDTLDHICDRFGKEVRDFETSGEMSDDLFHALYDYYFDDMPYGTKKGRDGDPYEWVSDRFAQDRGIDESNSGMIMPEADPISTFEVMSGFAAPTANEEINPMDSEKFTNQVAGAGTLGVGLGILESSCNMTTEGEYCPEHGLMECGVYEMGTVAGGMAPVVGEGKQDPLVRLKSLALIK